MLSTFINPILAAEKPKGAYHLVHDLRLINFAVVPLHPIVPNSYTLLSTVPWGTYHISILDLIDVFFSTPLNLPSLNNFVST